MIFKNIVRTSFFLALSAASVSAQLSALLDEPVELWTTQLLPDANLGSVEILKGNGVFMSPDGTTAMVTTVGGTVYAINAYNGEQKWAYQAPSSDSSSVVSSRGGVTVALDGSFLAFSVIDNENSVTPVSRVIALDMGGNEIWISDPLEGIAQGDPLISSDGAYVYLTHNTADGSSGTFTILDNSGGIFYSDSTDGVAFGPPGIFHNPTEGNYDPLISGAPVSEGENNSNDFLMWSQTPKPSDTTIQNGFLYGFQFPRDFAGTIEGSGNSSSVAYFELGESEVDFQSTTPPVITNGGLSAYWGVTRSSFRVWADKRFSRARTAAAGFTRNADFLGTAVFASPALSNDGAEPVMFGGTAAPEFVRLNFDFTAQLAVAVDSVIMSRAIVDPEERGVYFMESAGVLNFVDFTTLATIWNQTIDFRSEGEIAITPNYAVVVVSDSRGVLKAYQVAEIPVTESPSDFPSDMPSMSPTGDGTLAPTGAPVAPGSTPAPATAAPVAPASG